MNGDITARFEAYWGNSEMYPKDAVRGHYFEVVGEKGKMTIAGPDNYLIEYNDGSIEVVPIEGEFLSTGGVNVFRAFIQKKKIKESCMVCTRNDVDFTGRLYIPSLRR